MVADHGERDERPHCDASVKARSGEIRQCSRSGRNERDGATRMIFVAPPVRPVWLCKAHAKRFDLGRWLVFVKADVTQ